MAKKSFVQIVDLARAVRQPLARIPADINFPELKTAFTRSDIASCVLKIASPTFKCRSSTFSRDEEPHDFARRFENHVDAAITQEMLG